MTVDVDVDPAHSPVRPQIKQPVAAESKRLKKPSSPPEVRASKGAELDVTRDRSSLSVSSTDITASPIPPGGSAMSTYTSRTLANDMNEV